MLYHDYLDSEQLRGFDNYRYNSRDTSPLSNYVMHPFWNQVVKLCPKNIAPNVLTLVGFLCCIGHYALPAIYDYDFRSNTLGNNLDVIPSCIWASTAFLLFMAHTLDGIDGKQARRTNTSGPLGEMFDHGLDSWTTVFITTTLYSALGRNEDGFSLPPFRMYIILWSVFFSFHMSHLEKYNTGIMFLPWSYDIAMVSHTILYTLTAMFGTEFYKQDFSPYLVRFLETFFFSCTYLMALPMALNNIYQAYKNGTGKQPSFYEGSRPIVSLAIAFFLTTIWALKSPNDIMHEDLRSFWLVCGTICANMSSRLIVSQMTSTRCELFNWLLFPTAICVCVSLFVDGISLQTELNMLYGLLVIVTLVHLHYCVCVVIQLCRHLDIPCFSIQRGEKRKDNKSRLISRKNAYSYRKYVSGLERLV